MFSRKKEGQMKTLFFVCLMWLFFAMTACSSIEKRTRWTDPVMRVMVDPDSIDAANYVRIQNALVSSGKWTVLDRAEAYQAILTEQERQHRGQADRFDKKEKYAIWGRLFGVGGIVVAHIQCIQTWGSIFSSHGHDECTENLAIVSANTSEVITAIGVKENSEWHEMAPPWENAVDKMNSEFPTNFQPIQYSKSMELYRAEAREEGIRQEERLPRLEK